jgi:hypothetical protein
MDHIKKIQLAFRLLCAVLFQNYVPFVTYAFFEMVFLLFLLS